MTTLLPIGVIGAGAMGFGVVKSLRRAGIDVCVRDIRAEAEAAAAGLGARIAATPAALAVSCRIAIVLVVDAPQIETVLFASDGFVRSARADRIVVVSSTVDPDYVAALAPRLAAHGVTLVDAPVSGGPERACDGTMTVMVAGPGHAIVELDALLPRIAGKIFRVGTMAGDAARFKIVNNLLAAVNLAAGAEALALAVKAGLDPRQVVDVINASSGGSWIFADRMARALAGDFAPRAAARILAKDVGIAAEFAARLGVEAPFANAARAAFLALVAEGYGDDDDAVIAKRSLAR